MADGSKNEARRKQSFWSRVDETRLIGWSLMVGIRIAIPAVGCAVVDTVCTPYTEYTAPPYHADTGIRTIPLFGIRMGHDRT